MEETAARAWVEREFNVPRETMEKLDAFGALLREENDRQNSVSRTSLDRLWLRHIADLVQLLRFVSDPQAGWVDLGTGAGFPGLMVAALHPGPVVLVEERRLRADFLRRAAELLRIDVEVIQAKAQSVPPRPFDVISARAFAPLGRLLEFGTGFSTTKSIWIMPKGRNAETELAALDAKWQGEFRLEPSVTEPEARIIVATGVHRQGRGRSG